MVQNASSNSVNNSPFNTNYSPGFSPNNRSIKRSGILGSGVSSRVRRRLFFDDGSSDNSYPNASSSSNLNINTNTSSGNIGGRQRRNSNHSQTSAGGLNSPGNREIEEIAIDTIRQAVDEGRERVDLSDLGLTRLPSEVRELKDLVVLTPSRTLQTSLSMSLDSNLLRTFPSSLFQLRNLTVLNLSRNKLDSVPPDIYHLQNLSILSLAGNRIKYLPYEIHMLPKLTAITTHPNPYLEQPAEQRRRPFNHLTIISNDCVNDPDGMDVEEDGSQQQQQQRGNDHNAIPSNWPTYHVLTQNSLSSLTDLAARAIPPSNLKLLDDYQFTPSSTNPPRNPLLTQSPFIPPDNKQQSSSNIFERVRWTMDPKHSPNICAICQSQFLCPLLELIVWTTLSLTPDNNNNNERGERGRRWSSGNSNNRLIPFRVRICGTQCSTRHKLDNFMQSLFPHSHSMVSACLTQLTQLPRFQNPTPSGAVN